MTQTNLMNKWSDGRMLVSSGWLYTENKALLTVCQNYPQQQVPIRNKQM